MTRTRTLLTVLAALAFAAFALAPAAQAKPIKRAGWLRGVDVTEYYPAPEWWFIGKKVDTPGLARKSRVDWLYSATGMSMEGDGIGLDGNRYHIAGLGSGGWVTDRGKSSTPGHKGWAGGSPFWRAGAYWLSKSKYVTFPLDGGGWSNGVGVKYRPLPGVTFGEGPSRELSYYRSVAVDPDLIPLGSKVYIAAYRSSAGGGWFSADDIGGAIIGRHLDVYRTPPARADIGGGYLQDQRVYVQPPGSKAASTAPPLTKPRKTPEPAPPVPQPAPILSDPSGGAEAP
ncbi:3D domain-containing protein [Conexibacter sp. CPCC 206217]|uniref:3D domain-containing protein n=1 Tax=Conexibacter sp. CPCC 206217 TaxID=3064574 RepID=UPI002725E4A1|nr:3D domain-containing protein [Conexibacter sp. CPCC 206217]MDO8210568.1 3D domain-containing protein [Conexibacter sp. CPCC 206217]